MMNDSIYTIEEIRNILEKNLKDEPVYKVILFGSYAKSKANKFSDLDFLIDTNGKLRGFNFLELQYKLEKIFKKDVDVFENYEIIKGSRVDNEIKETGVIVYEK